MATIARRLRLRNFTVALATCYAAADDDALVIPEDLSTLSDEDLAALSTRASDAFDALYGDGSADFSADEMATLGSLTTAIEALAAEQAARDEAAAGRRAEAQALAARRNATLATEDEDDADDEDADDDADDSDDEDDADDADEDEAPPTIADAADQAAVETVTAAGRRTTINLASTRRRQPKQSRSPKPAPSAKSMRDVAYATSDTLGYADHAPVTWHDSGVMLDKRLGSFSLGQYQAAQARGQHIREQHSLMAFKRDVPKSMVASGTDADSFERAVNVAVDQSRLPGGALTAAGWCAPSENLYDLCYNESRDGLLSLPEVQVNRGGINVPVNPSFAELFANIGFHFTEAEAEAGKFAPGTPAGQPNVVGDKPCVEVECPEWLDYRLEGDGICIIGDLLQVRGYPEALARFTSGALVAHDHRRSSTDIARIIAGSTAVAMTTDTVGTTAPLLAAIELQTEHYRYAQRLSRNTLLEGVFPFWIRGAIRQDLSVRLGMRDFEVTDVMIDAWFRLRGLVPQYVYDWQAFDNGRTAAQAITWPATVQFLLYQAGTWVRGVDDIITLDTLYDSTLLGQNKFTALFTEEASLVAKRCVDSRVITVPVCSDGSTHAGVLLDCDLGATTAP
jgi:hypothetical protein